MTSSSGHKLSIVLVANAYFPADREGGPPHSNRELAEALVRAGATVRVVTTNRNGSQWLAVRTDQWINVGGVHVYYATTPSGAWGRGSRFRAAVRAALEDADACIMSAVFWNYTGLAAWIECRRRGVPYVTFVRGLLSTWQLRHKGMKKRVYWQLIARWIVGGSRAIIALARQEAADIARMNLRVPIVVIPNGAPRVCDSDLTGTSTEDARVPAAASGPYILFLGRIHPKKGVDTLVEAFAVAAAQGLAARLVIAGPVEASYAQAFSTLLQRCPVRDRIELVGTVSGSAKAALLAGALVFVLSSAGEGLPVAVLEAMSFGTPVIITSGCNLPEVAQAGAGLEVEANVPAVTEALLRMTGDERLRRDCSARARALAVGTFSWDTIGQRVLELCRDLSLPGRGSRASALTSERHSA